jgi:hypothetical protein
MMTTSALVQLFKRGLLGFWALWFTMVVFTNVCNALIEIGILPDGWRANSKNYQLIVETTKIYEYPDFINALLFALVIGWEVLIVVLAWRATLRYRRNDAEGLAVMYPPLLALAALWGGFILADEGFIIYDGPLGGVMSTHIRDFILLLATVLVIRLLPDEETV